MSSRRRTPMVCPLCDGELSNVQIRQLGKVTAGLNWEMHSGECPVHGWFQAEMISKPPREIFAVSQPGGVARKMVLGGKAIYAFPTVWDANGGRRPVDPYDPDMWAVDWSRLPGKADDVVISGN